VSSSSQDVHLAEFATPSISTYQIAVGAATYQTPGIVHNIIPVSVGTYAPNTPGVLLDGTSQNDQIIAVFPGNQPIGSPIVFDVPFQKGVFAKPAAGQAIIITYSTSPFKN